jgi:hypothetical protein
MTLKTTIIAFVMLAFGLGHAGPTRAQESLITDCTMKAQFARELARARDVGATSDKVITMINEQSTWTADDKARMIGLATMIYGDRKLTPDQWANEALLACMKRAR